MGWAGTYEEGWAEVRYPIFLPLHFPAHSRTNVALGNIAPLLHRLVYPTSRVGPASRIGKKMDGKNI
ncbi:hypothetical protein GCM10023156_01510 [Novipirellula rosea]|uniref:Uncharacterized protein n=1 Tax=Novipirellula rosea TaxID=1031540 RepID=A0ABP8M5Z0_9BACT